MTCKYCQLKTRGVAGMHPDSEVCTDCWEVESRLRSMKLETLCAIMDGTRPEWLDQMTELQDAFVGLTAEQNSMLDFALRACRRNADHAGEAFKLMTQMLEALQVQRRKAAKKPPSSSSTQRGLTETRN